MLRKYALKLLSSEALFGPKCTKCRLAAGLRPDPLGELNVPPDFLAVAGGGIKEGRGKEREKRGKGREKGKKI